VCEQCGVGRTAALSARLLSGTPTIFTVLQFLCRWLDEHKGPQLVDRGRGFLVLVV